MARFLNPTNIKVTDKDGLAIPLMGGEVESTDLETGYYTLRYDAGNIFIHVLTTSGQHRVAEITTTLLTT